MQAIARSACSVLACLCMGDAGARTGILQRDVVFHGYSPLATSAQLFERALTPLQEDHFLHGFRQQRPDLPEFTLDIEQERFSVFVPVAPPPRHGYGLLVFIPPWTEAAIPDAWLAPLEKTGTVLVVAANSGNTESTLVRRLALALHGWANAVANYPIDAERVYVGGFSGGARVALLAAVAYPDVFRGAILDGGADPIGSALVPLPESGLLRQAQENLRLVFLYGTDDTPNAAAAHRAIRSAAEACLPDATSMPMRRHGHAPAGAVWLLRALRQQESPHLPRADLADCRRRIERHAAAEVAAADARLAAGDRAGARKAIGALDAHWGHFIAGDIRRLAAETTP